MSVSVNGEHLDVQQALKGKKGTGAECKSEDGYIIITRKWKDGDKIHVDLPMHLTAETTPDGKPQYSFLYGPIVLAAKTGTDRQDGMYADDSRGGHIANGPKIPATQMPAMIGGTALEHLTAVDGKPMQFRLSGVSLPGFEGMTLQPFYKLYECRYQIYFPLYTDQEWSQKQQEIAAAEKAKMELEALTVDKIFCGEQQSESDHFFSGNGSWNGADEGIHWRRTRTAFSYQVKTDGVKSLRLKGFADREKVTVTLGDQNLGTVGFDRQGTATIQLPVDAKGTVKLTITAEPNSQTPRISEIRLCR